MQLTLEIIIKTDTSDAFPRIKMMSDNSGEVGDSIEIKP